MLRLVIFERNEKLGRSLVHLLNGINGYKVAGSFSTVGKIREIIKSNRPHLIIMDIDMPGTNSVSSIQIIKEIAPEILVVASTHFEDAGKIFKSLCSGADGYILKKASPSQLVKVLQQVEAGGAHMSPAMAKMILTSFRSAVVQRHEKYALTRREKEVLKLLVKGYSVKYIASELNIAFETGRSHLKNIYTKLNVNCGKEAIAKVLAERVIL